jgi:hypothetical protein
MEFLKPNYLDTTSALVVNNATDRGSYLFDRDVTFQYVSNGMNNDATTVSIRVNFNETLPVSRIALVEHNLKAFTIFYNGSTANTFALTSSGSTVTSDFATNSETSHFLRANTVYCTSVTLELKSTIVANQEKAIGFLVISDPHVVLDRPPPAKGYKISIDPQDTVHKLSDGGTRIQNIADKYSAQLSYSFLSTSERNSLKALYDRHQEFLFCAFGTTTGWDEVLFPCVWTGNFDFFQFSDNAATAGFSGKINLLETPR